MDPNVLKDALQKGKIEKIKDEIEYLRVKDPFRDVERGTVITNEIIVPSYPHIKRIFTLENGLKKNIHLPIIYAEEKIDGYNVRIVSIKGDIYAFSRGGFLDAFVTEKVREMKLEKFFKDFPKYMLCGEMIGNTPHTEPTDQFDVRLYIFDIYNGKNFLGCDERYRMVSKYGMPSIPKIGKFQSDDYPGLRRVVLALNKGRKEGVVLKSSDRTEAVKYVTAYSDIEDIAQASNRFLDMPLGFYYQRILRSAMFINDFGMNREEHAKRLGMAFYRGLEDSVNRIKQGKEISEEFEIFIKDEKVWKDILKHSSKDAKIEEIFRKVEKGKTRIRFRRIYKNTTKILNSYSKGKAIED
ncbi:RNA ligase [Candidatus Bilamarchaeum dharawalense]|uniref:RNA ligase n=1 Tax=Candidatus Bilamarchaeum dharawalense TaxID=2885759 RepID=A0A5E4LR40_9ARCH|nr:RNA ligase [Candidatus Bilamarchaeum dharawalense]